MTITIQKPLQVAEIESKKELVKKLFCKGCTDEEMELFIHACKRTRLDPFMKQIYCIKRGNQVTIQTSIDGLRLIAERTGCYSPGKEPMFVHNDKGELVSATSYIKKRTDDGTWHEVAAVAYMEEYNAKQNLWNKMPRVMLSKCAEALALRKAFPAEMSGLYSDEEMSQAEKGKRTNIEEEDWAKLDYLVQEAQNNELVSKLCSFVNADTIHDILPKDFDRIIKRLEQEVSMKMTQVKDESTIVA